MLWKQILAGMMRSFIATAGGYLVANGTLSADDLNTIVGGIAAIVPVVWSAFDKIATANKTVPAAPATGSKVK